ncbi:EamA domain-containing membrane protein RarD [Natranaerovirga hydrolytica]|uniref:EamA domain-containing membrane protein RarD n=1 Tax=Natranaerovirga hydrolytica TaxID=680378 RepID=A0A4R1MS37_9FIRM|nr:DMT family transporter [Natranaerovirga hydrolytica]TCK92733.1 EamA domain-containing membrane protein RarD [Natranaerovirga hydrolytica]
MSEEESLIQKEKNKVKAIGLMLFSAFSFAIMGVFVKALEDIPSFEKALFRNLISLIIVLAVLYKRKESPWGHKDNRKYLLGRGIFGTLGLLSFFYALDTLYLADASMLNRLSPFFVILFAAIFLKEKIRKYQMFSVFIALLGVLLIVKPSFEFQESLPALIGLMSGVFAGIAYVFVSYLGKKESPYTIVFYFSFISTIVTGIIIIPHYVSPNFIELVLLIGTGITASIGQFALTYAYKYAPAGEVSIYNYSNIIFAGILGFIFFSEMPDILSLMGYVFIVFAGYIIYKYGKGK